jgi:hypothetical protein
MFCFYFILCSSAYVGAVVTHRLRCVAASFIGQAARWESVVLLTKLSKILFFATNKVYPGRYPGFASVCIRSF